jgi:hypothetical protein
VRGCYTSYGAEAMNWRCNGLRLGVVAAILIGCLAASPARFLVRQQSVAPEQDAGELVRAAVANEVASANNSTKHLFRSRKQRPGVTQTRLYVQTTDAMAGMLIAIDDKPISAEQMAGELAHLQHLIDNSDDLRRKQKQEREDEGRTLRIMQALPYAFLYEYEGEEPSQPDIGKREDELVRLKFRPNPRYSPPSREEQVLTGMEGHLLIDRRATRLAKIDAALFRDVSFGWGILGHLDRGGNFTVCQADVGDGSWEITRMQLAFTGKILLVKSVAFKQDEVLSGFRRVPDDTTFAKGVELLKSEAAAMQKAPAVNADASSQRQ